VGISTDVAVTAAWTARRAIAIIAAILVLHLVETWPLPE